MNKRQSQFNKCVKVREAQYNWLAENLKQYKTLAGRLDFIINHYKNDLPNLQRDVQS